MTKVGFISLGCSKNLVDTEVMLYNLHSAGFEITPNEEEAEIIVINTCGFIESAKKEAIDNILDAERLKEWGKCKHIIATGCLVERYGEEVMRELPELDAIVGVGSLAYIADACSAVMRGENNSPHSLTGHSIGTLSLSSSEDQNTQQHQRHNQEKNAGDPLHADGPFRRFGVLETPAAPEKRHGLRRNHAPKAQTQQQNKGQYGGNIQSGPVSAHCRLLMLQQRQQKLCR